jgi:release factor glutamine methyltransferase
VARTLYLHSDEMLSGCGMNTTVVDSKEWTILSLIGWSAEYLASKEFESPRLTAELLLCHILECRRIELYTNFDKVLTSSQLAQFKSHLKRRLAHEPVQYIVGSTEFMGLHFDLDPRTLIPRPETEVVVEQVIAHVRAAESASPRILDIGTGSGNIAVSLAKFLPAAEVIGIDISPEALESARRNVERHGVGERVSLRLLDIRGGRELSEAGTFDYIVSNPPYVPEADVASLPPEIREYEPLLAVRAEGDGLGFYRTIAQLGPILLKKGGWVFFEIGFDQHAAVSAILSEAGFNGVAAMPDYGGILRVVKGRLGPAA